MHDDFNYAGERFADVQMLRYRLDGFEMLTLGQKRYVYYLAKAALCGRDITTDQFGKYNLRIRKLLECLYINKRGVGNGTNDSLAFDVYLKRVWFSNGIYHHYGCEKFAPGYSEEYLRSLIESTDKSLLPLREGESVEMMCNELFPVIFHPEVLPKRVNKADGEDLVKTSACNFYEGVSQEEVEAFYAAMQDAADDAPPSYGLNSKLVKQQGKLKELTWKEDGR